MKHFDFVHLDDILSGCHLPKNAAIITFDDGFKSTYTHALPILHKLNIPATVFLTGNHIENQTVPWIAHLHGLLDQASLEDRILFYQGETFRLASFSHKIKLLKKLKQKFKALTNQVINKSMKALEQDLDVSVLSESINESFMNYDEIITLGKHNWTIGNHTYHHLNLKNLDKNKTKREIESTREILTKFGHYRDVLALPFGGNSSYSSETIQAAKETGMKLMFTTNGTNNYKKRNSIVNRVICETYSFRYFLFNVTGKKEAFLQLFSQ
jgi:peptidoglycan/xylan/chitin deacetylase (PgdA/CDA1 family)